MRANSILGILLSLLLGLSVGCQNKSTTTNVNVKDNVSQALNNGGFKDISVDVNNDKELVTLKGDVKSQDEKDQVEQLAKGAAAGYSVSDEVGIRPEGQESNARKIDSSVDSAIEKNFKAALITNRMENQHIRYTAKNGVLTLKGKVNNEATREKAQKLAARVPNVQQVVNELDIKGGKRANTTPSS